MEAWARDQPPYKTMFSLCCDQIISLYKAQPPVNQTSVDNICHFLTLAVYRNHTSVGVMDFQNLAPVDLAWWIDGFMTTVITIVTIFLNTISIIIFTSSSLRSPTNAILAMISALDVLTCVLRAPLLIYVYLYRGYRRLPSMAWCTEYNYIHNFIPSALHSTAFLLNMGLAVQRCVGVGDIRRLRAICCYKGTIAIALISFCMSAFIHSLYPISYKITPVVALGKQMLESGKLEEVETCKVSARYPEKFETLSTSYAWARISALQLLPGIVMCVCNISLITISYKTYNYRKRLIGAIGTIMNINQGFEGDVGENKELKDREESKGLAKDDGTDGFQYSLEMPNCEFSSVKRKEGCSNFLEKRLNSGKDLRENLENSPEICNGSAHNDKPSGNEGSYLNELKIKNDDSVREPPCLPNKEKNVTQELHGALNDSDRVLPTNLFQPTGNNNTTREHVETIASNTDYTEQIKNVDINDVEIQSASNAEEGAEEKKSNSDTPSLWDDTDTKTNAMIFENEIYENISYKTNQLPFQVPKLKDIAHDLLQNSNMEFLTNSAQSLNDEKDTLSRASFHRSNNIIGVDRNISIDCTGTEQTQSQGSNALITFPDTDRKDGLLISTMTVPERKGSDASSMISSTIVEDNTIGSNTLSENSKTRSSKEKKKVKSSNRRRGVRGKGRGGGRGGGDGSVAELRPTIMLVLVTSCTLLAELMVTVAIFINFMNQVVDRSFVQEDTLITFILVSNLITMVSFPINFVFFSGLSRPFRNTFTAYAQFVVRRFSRILSLS